MVGKRIRIKRLSASVANVVIENHAGDTITTLVEGILDNVEVEATPDAWEIFN